MRKFVIMVVVAAQGVLLSGCAAMWKNVAYSDDLYSVHNKIAIAERQKAEAELAKAQYEAQQAQYEAQRAQYEATLAQANAQAAQQGIIVSDESTLNGYDAVLADSYESAYARRLYGFSSPTYNMPSSYYTWRYSDAFHYASAYDPAFYNIVVSGDMVWVEPKYVTSMFGTWGAAVIPSYGWYYSWNNPYYYWNSSYRWNWYYSWNHPYYWGWGCNSPYSYHHHHHSYYPHHNHRPSYHRPPQHGGRPPQHDNRPPQAGSGSVGNTGHHQINRPGTVVDRNPGPSRPADRVTTGSPRPSGPSVPSTPSTGRVSQPVNRVGGTSSGSYTTGSSSYRSGSGSSSSTSKSGSSSTSKSNITQKSPTYRSGSSSNATKSSPTYRNSSSSSSSSSRSSSSSSSSYKSGSSSRSYSSPSSGSSHSSSSRPSSSGGNSRGR